jgi:hypothetical protein
MEYFSSFFIARDKHEEALATLKDLVRSGAGMSGGSWEGGKKTGSWFSWVSSEDVLNAKTLQEAMLAFRWETSLNEAGDIVSICFEGEKLGDDEVFFHTLAPFVEDGSYVAMQGENGAMWRWVFTDGKCREITAEITWED